MKKCLQLLLIVSLCSLGALLVVACDPGPTNGAFLRVDALQCTGCGECRNVCDANAIAFINGKPVIDPSKCVECGDCVEVCPEDAIE